MKMNQKNPIRIRIGRNEITKPSHWGGLRKVTLSTLASRRSSSESVMTAVVRNWRMVRGSPLTVTWVSPMS